MPAERQLLEQVASCELDEHLTAIADAVDTRRERLHMARSVDVVAELRVGDSVLFTAIVRPRYLEA
jgi:hypothetical protein